MNSRHAGPHASAVGRTVPQDPALTLSGAPGGWGRPVPGELRVGAMVGRRGNRLAANVLEAAVVVEVSDGEDARGFDSGRFALPVDLSCGGERPAADPRKVRGFPARPLEETADGSGNREMVQPGQGLRFYRPR